MAVRTSSSNRPNPSATASVALGTLAVAAIPLAVVASRYVPSIPLLRALYAGVPAAVALGLLARSLSRRARQASQLSLRSGGKNALRAGRILSFAGLYVGTMGALALGCYAALRLYS